MEWVVAVVVMFAVSAVVVGLPVLALTTFWDSRRRVRARVGDEGDRWPAQGG